MENNKHIIRSIIMAILGCIVLGLGIGMMAKVGIGNDPLSATYVGISKITNLSLGTVTALANVVMCAVALLLYKKNVGPTTIIFILVSKWPVDFANKYMIRSDNLVANMALCIVSIAVIALGSELCILSDLCANSYDAMTMGIGKRLKHDVKYIYIRYACDGILLLVAFLIGGDIGIGTLLSWVFIGLFMKQWQSALCYCFNIETN